jgi:hypothetical protein
MSGNISYSLPFDDPDTQANQAGSTSPGGDAEVKWEIVARTSGLAPATIVAGRLQVEGIPARAYQEGAGRALGLTVGILGTGFVAVPEEYAEKALRILNDTSDESDDESDSFIG